MAAADEVTQIVAESHLHKVIGDATSTDEVVAALVAASKPEVMAKAGRLVLTFDLKRTAPPGKGAPAKGGSDG